MFVGREGCDETSVEGVRERRSERGVSKSDRNEPVLMLGWCVMLLCVPYVTAVATAFGARSSGCAENPEQPTND